MAVNAQSALIQDWSKSEYSFIWFGKFGVFHVVDLIDD